MVRSWHQKKNKARTTFSYWTVQLNKKKGNCLKILIFQILFKTYSNQIIFQQILFLLCNFPKYTTYLVLCKTVIKKTCRKNLLFTTYTFIQSTYTIIWYFRVVVQMRNTLQKMHIDNFVHLASRTSQNL